MATQPIHISPQEYLRSERISDQKHEYLNGEVFAMAGASRTHRRITTNILTFLVGATAEVDCEADNSDTRIYIPASGRYTYPDVVLTCGPQEYPDDGTDTLLNPSTIVGVLSAKTEAYDRGEKFRSYCSIPSFSEYVLVSQERRWAEHFLLEQKEDDGVRHWRYTAYDGIGDGLPLRCGIKLPLDAIYARVRLTSN